MIWCGFGEGRSLACGDSDRKWKLETLEIGMVVARMDAGCIEGGWVVRAGGVGVKLCWHR